MNLRVTYKIKEKIDAPLDKKIIKAMKGIGFIFYASGCNRINGERDVTFRDPGAALKTASGLSMLMNNEK